MFHRNFLRIIFLLSASAGFAQIGGIPGVGNAACTCDMLAPDNYLSTCKAEKPNNIVGSAWNAKWNPDSRLCEVPRFECQLYGQVTPIEPCQGALCNAKVAKNDSTFGKSCIGVTYGPGGGYSEYKWSDFYYACGVGASHVWDATCRHDQVETISINSVTQDQCVTTNKQINDAVTAYCKNLYKDVSGQIAEVKGNCVKCAAGSSIP